MFPEAPHEGPHTTPPYTPFLAPKLGESPWSLQDPARKRAFEAEKNRQKRNAVKTSFLNTGQLAVACLRCIIAGEIVGAWAKFGGLGALLTNLASLVELSVIQNMETASRFERAQSAARPHLARERGSLQTIKEELVKMNRGRLHQCVNGQISEFAGRQKGRRDGGSFPNPNRARARKRKRSRSQRGGADGAREPKQHRSHRNRSPRDSREAKRSKYPFPVA